MTIPATIPTRTGLHGRVSVTVRNHKGRLLSQRVSDNLETQYALNSIATWLVGGAGIVAPAPPAYLAFGVGPVNQLAAALADMEANPTGWQPSSNCTVAQSPAAAWQGLYSLAITASSAATMTATTPPGLSACPVVAGYQYAADGHFLAATTPRNVGINIAWYDNTGTIISTSTGTTLTDSTTAWTRSGVVATAPANAAYAAVQATITSPSSSEVHYLDGAQLAYAPDGPYPWQDGYTDGAWSPVSPTVTDTALSQERYLTRAQIDTGYTQNALAVLLHTYQQSDPSGSFYEAGLWDAPATTTITLAAQANPGDTTLTLTPATAPAVAAGTQIYIPQSVTGTTTFPGEYATIANAAPAGATTWTLTDNLLLTHPATTLSGTTTVPAPVVAFTGNLWAHIALTSVTKAGTNLLTLQWEITVSDAT